MFATTWVDRDRKYFIGTCEGTTPGNPEYRIRWRQLDDLTTNEPPLRMLMEIPMPKIVEAYFGFASKIDQLNSQRQKQLEMEKYVRTKDWSKRVGLSILSMCIIDAMNFHQQCKPDEETDRDPHEWFSRLAEELIDNKIDSRVSTRRAAAAASASAPQQQSATRTMHPDMIPGLTPVKEKNTKGFAKQRWCRECKNFRATTQCRVCSFEEGAPVYVCNTKSGRNCWNDHYADHHA